MELTAKPRTLNDLARFYKVDKRTVKKWLKPFSNEIGAKAGNYYTIKQLTVIIDKIGTP